MKFILLLIIFTTNLFSQFFTIARIQYSGGGDWYSDPSSLPNLLAFVGSNTPIKTMQKEIKIKLTDNNANHYPYYYLTGHGNIKFTNDEIISLREILSNGGFLHADDNYGMDKSFRREIKKIFPSKELIELPHDHPIFKSYFKFNNGLPKIHEHDNKPPQAFGIFNNNKLVVLYTYESDLGDGWEDPSVHNCPEKLRENALKMGVNIIYYALTQ